MLLTLVNPYRFLPVNEQSISASHTDIFSRLFYGIFVLPVQTIGRVLWLMVDFLIIERTLLSSLAKCNDVLVQGFVFLHKRTYGNILLMLLVGIGAVVIGIYWRK